MEALFVTEDTAVTGFGASIEFETTAEFFGLADFPGFALMDLETGVDATGSVFAVFPETSAATDDTEVVGLGAATLFPLVICDTPLASG